MIALSVYAKNENIKRLNVFFTKHICQFLKLKPTQKFRAEFKDNMSVLRLWFTSEDGPDVYTISTITGLYVSGGRILIPVPDEFSVVSRHVSHFLIDDDGITVALSTKFSHVVSPAFNKSSDVPLCEPSHRPWIDHTIREASREKTDEELIKEYIAKNGVRHIDSVVWVAPRQDNFKGSQDVGYETSIKYGVRDRARSKNVL